MLNPIVYTEKVVSDFLRYQLTAYPFADAHLYQQMRTLLNLETTRSTPLFKGPYVSLSRSFQQGATIERLIQEGIFHPGMRSLIPYPSLYGHQETAVRHIHAGKTTIISTGTGSGKTECFLYPIISHCFHKRDRGMTQGITAVIVYPMNALAEDQLGRLRGLLVGTGISFGMYVRNTKERAGEVSGSRCRSKADYNAALEKLEREKSTEVVRPTEERASREEMRRNPPQILLTNVKQLELLLTRQQDVELFDGATLDYLVFDEAHTFSGSSGAETACLIRRLRTFCGKTPAETVCIATSATIADPHTKSGRDVATNFAHRFFGVPRTQVELVAEQYEDSSAWHSQRHLPPPFKGDPATRLNDVLSALEKDAPGNAISYLYQQMWGEKPAIDPELWQEELYDRLAANDLVFQIHLSLRRPLYIRDLIYQLTERFKRAIGEEEVLIWLALGAASRKEGRPLLRPVIHGFVRGVGGAVVTFDNSDNRPTLWLSAEEQANNQQSERFALPVLTCTTCGQHYFEHWVQDFQFKDKDKQPKGGQAHGDRTIWIPQSEEHQGTRVLLSDRLISESDEDPDSAEPPGSTVFIYFCRACGTLHNTQVRCLQCSRQGQLVPLLVIPQKSKSIGQLHRCICCRTQATHRFGRLQEPARPIRATAVSDVHVLAQNMLHQADRKRLLIFADNRQDAAFQAGWMQDHARRFRLRALMDEQIRKGNLSIGDLTAQLDRILEDDDDLSRAIAPEVWRATRKEESGIEHRNERKYFLRLQVLRELTTGLRQRLGLEPWGRLKVLYAELTPEKSFIEQWATLLGIDPTSLCEGIASLLDVARRNTILLDRDRKIFSRIWQDGDREVQYGYLPLLQGVPKGLKLTRDSSDNTSRVQQWVSEKADTTAKQAARQWGVEKELTYPFFEKLWQFLTQDLQLLVPSPLENSQGKRLPNCNGVHQLDADKLLISAHRGVYRCDRCRRTYPRPTPKNSCIAWRCDGTLNYEQEDPDNYDLRVLDEQFTMIRPREHSAQVPTDDREILERMFKGSSQQVNALVCTPTLEMGVDIGALDVTLMRNIPPLPANYWQRAGRAGRRFRMAVNFTYARPASHDRAYFRDPLKLLDGEIQPPRINLKNTLMVRKHVHAAVLTILQQLARPQSALPPEQREALKAALDQCLPTQVKTYLFDEHGHVRQQPLQVNTLGEQIECYESEIVACMNTIFRDSWTQEDSAAVSEDELVSHVRGMQKHLQAVIQVLWKRLQWALGEMARLDALRRQKGTLEPDEDANHRRCDRLVKQLKGQANRRRRDAEGFDDTNTYGVLATEGFLPGHGLDTGSVRGTALIPVNMNWLKDFGLPRPSGVALREYSPGNLIYANSNRFTPRRYHLDTSTVENALRFQVDIANGAIVELGSGNSSCNLGSGALTVRAIPMPDVDLAHQSTISDDESFRFQMPVTTLGYERDRHGGGHAYTWGTQTVHLRENVYLRLVNVGATNLVRDGKLGYTICLTCGQSRSPFASLSELTKFSEHHADRCGVKLQREQKKEERLLESTGFFADITAHTLSLQDCEDRTVAYSIIEAIRHGAASVLEMELEDLQILTIAHPGSERVDALLYDPMPGGSGLLEQLLDKWVEVVREAIEVLQNCSSRCETACIDCLFTFRNAFYHRFLNRHKALEKLQVWDDTLTHSHPIPAKLPTTEEQKPTNQAEARLAAMLKRAGFPDPIPQHAIDLGKPLERTTPDFFYEVPDDEDCLGLCIYLDGMSRNLHGNPDRANRDSEIRAELLAREYEVIEVIASNLDDRQAMAKIFFRIAKVLMGKTEAKQIRDNPSWFGDE